MGFWFAILAVTGAVQVASDPEILKALSPIYAVEFFAENFGVAFIALGAVVLASPAPRPSTPTWATSAARRSAAPGSSSSSRR